MRQPNLNTWIIFLGHAGCKGLATFRAPFGLAVGSFLVGFGFFFRAFSARFSIFSGSFFGVRWLQGSCSMEFKSFVATLFDQESI